MNSTNNELVSILIPTWQGAEYLAETLDSILAQTWQPLEIIVSDDGSTDATLDIVRGYQATCPGLTLVHNPAKGMVNNWNNCIVNARGAWLKFVFQDDLIEPDCITQLMALAARDPELGLIYSRRSLLMSGGATANAHCKDIFSSGQDPHAGWGIVRPIMAGSEYLNNPALFEGNANKIGEPSAVLIRTDVFAKVGMFDPGMIQLIDFEMWTRIMAHYKIGFVDAALAVFRIHPGQQSVKNVESGAINQDMIAFCEKVLTEACYEHLPLSFKARTFAILNKFLRQFQHEVADFRSQRDLGSAQMRRQTQQLVDLRAVLLDTQISLTTAEAQILRKEAVAAALRSDLDLIYSSRSWRLTKPLRMASRVQTITRAEGWVSVLRRIYFKLFRTAPQMPVASSQLPVPGDYAALEFPQFATPRISIVIPVYNKFEYTYHCLKSILANSGDQSYEVIVVDDCSQDKTPEYLARITGIRVIRNTTNGGFIYSCNTGAQAARGEFLVLFNNDTEPQPLWLSALLHTFRDFPDAGMVGAKLLYPDGSLQEAGGIVWRDGSAWNYGRNDDPNKPEYSWCRQVDYCSGACLMLPLADFMALGMFDTLYTPAYYEDTDLAFKVRQAGKKVYYQPLARVIHFEGVSCGTDATGGIKEYQHANHAKFFTRWQETLREHQTGGVSPELEKERYVEKRVLVVDARILMPDHDSGSLRMFNLLKIFQSLGYKVTFVPDNLQYHEKYSPLLQGLGIECLYHPYLKSIDEHLHLAGKLYQVVLLSRADYAEKYIDVVRMFCPQAQILFDTVDLHFLRERRLAEMTNDKAQIEAADMRKLQELNTARKAHQTLIVSPVEIDLFRREAPDVKVALLSNIHAAEGRGAAFDARSDILFIGSFEHPPNVDAMHWFIDDVFPLLHTEKPQLTLRIVGGGAPRKLLAKAGPNIVFDGFVDDITPIFTSIRLSIAPLRYGAGVKGKINSSMSYGVPVIATTVAAEGMGLEHGRDVLIADEPAAFAAAIIRLYDDEQLWYALSNAGLENIERCFSFDVATEQLRKVLAEHPVSR